MVYMYQFSVVVLLSGVLRCRYGPVYFIQGCRRFGRRPHVIDRGSPSLLQQHTSPPSDADSPVLAPW